MRFGLNFSPEELRTADPEGYVGARVWLGAFTERVACCTDIWSVADYQRHWRVAAGQCVAGLPEVVFATDRYSDGLGNGWALFVGVKSRDSYRFVQILSALDEVYVDEQRLLTLRGAPLEISDGVSIWDVPTHVIEQSLD